VYPFGYKYRLFREELKAFPREVSMLILNASQCSG